jgi:N-formylglutamate deformylase
MGYSVRRNVPYPGGHITDHYGQPAAGLHSLQIEINRGLYLDEARFERMPEWDRLADDMSALVERICSGLLGGPIAGGPIADGTAAVGKTAG